MSLVIPVEESKGWDVHVEDEWYAATVVDLETTDGEYGPGLKWVFNLDGELQENGAPRDTWGFTGQKITARTKLGKWVAGILGELPPAGQPVNLAGMVGARVQVMFEHDKGLDRDGNPIVRDKVVKVRALRSATPAATGVAGGQSIIEAAQTAPTVPTAPVATAPTAEPF